MKNVHLIPTDKPSRLGRFVDTDNLFLRTPNDLPRGENVNVCITNSEDIKDGYVTDGENLFKVISNNFKTLRCTDKDNNLIKLHELRVKKIILTTDPELIKDGVQEIPNDFLEWFVNSPSCQYDGYKDIAWDQIITLKEKPKQYPIGGYAPGFYSCECITCKTEFMGDKLAIQCEPCAIKTTQEEPKQETIEEAAVKYVRNKHDNTHKLISKYSFKDGAKSNAARDYWFSQFQKQDKTKFSEEDMKAAWENGMKSAIVLNASFEMWLKQFKNKLI
jgi:hypothetical protein